MSRWIDADAFIADARMVGLDTAEKVLFALAHQPSIDIVRCRECKYAEVSVSPITGLWCTRFGINDMAMEDDDFCSHGQRKESER